MLDRPSRRDIDALRGHHLRLAVERQVMVELGDHDMGERSERRLVARDRLYGRRCLHDLLAGAAAILGANGATTRH